jgi:hypothetical protein
MSFFNPDKEAMSPLQRNLLLIMSVFLLFSGIYITILGGVNGAERIFGILILVALAIINALDDTMIDLFTDTVGGIVGALLGILLIRRAEKAGGHWKVADGMVKNHIHFILRN